MLITFEKPSDICCSFHTIFLDLNKEGKRNGTVGSTRNVLLEQFTIRRMKQPLFPKEMCLFLALMFPLL